MMPPAGPVAPRAAAHARGPSTGTARLHVTFLEVGPEIRGFVIFPRGSTLACR